ncbi:G protein beta subunit-like protein [Cladophialophora yegresii CBS 114405]|uniref:G protein beta subunit-like protein n=1 Tax=Cladophialophora yegresii CBS 114405 TaxID=1182544 RepID=W9W3N1_9EURO|nr:G protein beta subunit-like protein [Cladophialophora yegresii CBS 114405]EXJ59146.1 G protein beta subunit-like protein [Cladophialophora yegresii CBS 114405]
MSVILSGYDHTIRFWEALSGICSRTIQHPESQVNRLCITPDKKYLAAAGRHMVRLYDIKSSNPNPVQQFEGHTNNITGVAFHCEGKWMVTSSEDMTVRVWDTRTGMVQRNYQHSHPVNDVVIHPNQGELVSCDRGGNIRIWDLGESKCTHQLVPVEDVSMASVSVASDGSLLAAGNNLGDVYIWRMYQNHDSTTLLPCRVFKAHKDYLTRLLLSPDIKLLATCSADHTVRIWKIDMNEEHLEVIPEQQSPTPSPHQNGTSSTPGAHAPKQNHHSSASSQSQSSLRLNTEEQDGNTSETSLNPKPFRSATSLASTASGTTSSPQSQFRANVAPGFGTDLISARRPLPCDVILDNHQRWVWDCAFSADSAYLVTVCSDHYARLWELSSATIIRQYNGHHRGAVCVALNDYSSPP